MEMAHYMGQGSFPLERWIKDFRMELKCHWLISQRPDIIEISISSGSRGARLKCALASPVLTMDERKLRYVTKWKRGTSPGGTSTLVQLTFDCVTTDSNSIEVRGLWSEHGLDQSKPFELQATCVETGRSDIPVPDVRIPSCDIQHLAAPLEQLLNSLHTNESLSALERKKLALLLKQFNGRICNKNCNPSSCSLRSGPQWLVLYRYRDLLDVLTTKQSGIELLNPTMKIRSSVETLVLKGLKRPGHISQ